jgi:hypothetical protein
MLFSQRFWQGIADGSITVAFRRWKRPTVRAGGNLRSPGGYLAIDSVEVTEEAAISEQDARHAGFPSRDELLAELRQRPDGKLYRIGFHVAGPDPREALREIADLSEDDIATIRGRLQRLDESNTGGPWTEATLALIRDMPERRAKELAATIGEPDLARFKERVRKLKALGLTESLHVGYRLSPRGRAYVGGG